MVKMSTADFISLIGNLKEEVNITVSVDNINAEEKKVLSKYEVCTSGISTKEEIVPMLIKEKSILVDDLTENIVNRYIAAECNFITFPENVIGIASYEVVYKSKDNEKLTLLQSMEHSPIYLKIGVSFGIFKEFKFFSSTRTNTILNRDDKQLVVIDFVNADGISLLRETVNEKVEAKYIIETVIETFKGVGFDIDNLIVNRENTIVYKTTYANKNNDRMVTTHACSYPPTSIKIKGYDEFLFGGPVVAVKDEYYNPEEPFKIQINDINITPNAVVVKDTVKKELSVTEVLEQKITKAFIDIGYHVDRLDENSKLHTLLYNTEYHCSDTDSYLSILHPYEYPPHAFAIDDRGITKMFIAKDTEMTNEVFDIKHPIKVVM